MASKRYSGISSCRAGQRASPSPSHYISRQSHRAEARPAIALHTWPRIYKASIGRADWAVRLWYWVLGVATAQMSGQVLGGWVMSRDGGHVSLRLWMIQRPLLALVPAGSSFSMPATPLVETTANFLHGKSVTRARPGVDEAKNWFQRVYLPTPPVVSTMGTHPATTLPGRMECAKSR